MRHFKESANCGVGCGVLIICSEGTDTLWCPCHQVPPYVWRSYCRGVHWSVIYSAHEIQHMTVFDFLWYDHRIRCLDSAHRHAAHKSLKRISWKGKGNGDQLWNMQNNWHSQRWVHRMFIKTLIKMHLAVSGDHWQIRPKVEPKPSKTEDFHLQDVKNLHWLHPHTRVDHKTYNENGHRAQNGHSDGTGNRTMVLIA